MSNFLMHYGIPGMKWGVRRTPEQLGHYKDPKKLSQKMQRLKYKEYTRLKSPKETMKNGGSCHDQTFAELKMLRKMGKKPKGMFIMEVDDHGQGGMTHSLAYYQEGRNTVWFENAWEGRRGVHSMKSPRAIKMEIKKAHKSGEFGNKGKYKNLIFSDFHEKGSSGWRRFAGICGSVLGYEEKRLKNWKQDFILKTRSLVFFRTLLMEYDSARKEILCRSAINRK